MSRLLLFLVYGLLSSGARAATPPLTAVTFSPDGKAVLAVSQSGLHVYDWPTLRPRRNIPLKYDNLHCLAFSPNGKRLAIGGGDPTDEGGIQLLDWPSCKLGRTIAGHSDSVRSIAWLNDKMLLTASVDRAIRQWNVNDDTTKPKPLRELRGHARSVDSICLLPKRHLLISAGIDRSLRVWDGRTGKLLRNLTQHTRPVNDLAVRPGVTGIPMIASASADRTIRFWQPTIGRMVRFVRLKSQPLAIAWQKDGTTILAACVDGKLRFINADEVTVTRQVQIIQGWAYACAVHPHTGDIVVAGAGGQLRRVSRKGK